MTTLLIGRFQPLQEGHLKRVETLLREGRKVVIGLRDGPRSTANPFSADERRLMFQRRFGDAVTVIQIPEAGGLEIVSVSDKSGEFQTWSLESEPEPPRATSGPIVQRKARGQTLWFLGLPASGKTTLAGKVVRESAGYLLLDGDDVRQTVENFDMGQDARRVHLSYMAFCCRQLNECGINVAAAFVTPLEQHRARVREILRDVKFIWLQCAPETCATRDPKGLWKKAAGGNLPQLTGAGGAWEDPTESALTIRTDAMSVDQAFGLIKQRFDLIGTGVEPPPHRP
jgi:adenylylsulfate kinase